ncbi:MAG: hypothetical protein JW827_05805 [Spirochaetes bacterium]|nr:hypothetical protein [Spirochaetota bacterium]
MKQLVLGLLISLIFILPIKAQFLFNLGIEEGAIVSAGDLQFINDITTDLAVIFPLADKHSLITYYQLTYNGPGIVEGQEASFSERAQSHYFMAKHLWKVSDKIFIKPKVGFLMEFNKFGKNEEWGEGLYDLNKFTFGSSFAYSDSLSFAYDFQIYKYPNYSDLYTLYLTDFTKDEPAEDYKNHRFSLSYKNSSLINSMVFLLEYDLSLSFYDNKKVLGVTGYTGPDDQKSTHHYISFLPQLKSGHVVLGLNLIGEINDSNQNYIFGYDPSSIQYKENFFSYTTGQVKPIISFLFGKEDSLSVMFSFLHKRYKNRPSQEPSGIFTRSRLYVESLSAGLSYYVKLSKYFALNPSYAFVNTKSNNDYSQAADYNYDAHVVSISLNYTY